MVQCVAAFCWPLFGDVTFTNSFGLLPSAYAMQETPRQSGKHAAAGLLF